MTKIKITKTIQEKKCLIYKPKMDIQKKLQSIFMKILK